VSGQWLITQGTTAGLEQITGFVRVLSLVSGSAPLAPRPPFLAFTYRVWHA
jgi:hypothetical protein